MLTQKRLKELLNYNPETGVFTNKTQRSSMAPLGSPAGCVSIKSGYIQITLDNKQYRAHQLAWFTTYRYWPQQVDHINGNRSDNRISNLREATYQINAQNIHTARSNNKLGILGVSKNRYGNKYCAIIKVNGKRIRLGSYNTTTEAHNAYIEAKRRFHEYSTL